MFLKSKYPGKIDGSGLNKVAGWKIYICMQYIIYNIYIYMYK